jgi:hypothetical protein
VQLLDERAIRLLVVVNLGLQLFDGLATYTGLHSGFGEGNPLLRWALGAMGPASALLLFKLQACACLLLLWHVRTHRLAGAALAFCAAVYVVCSVAPWTMALAGHHLDMYAAS